MIIYRALPDLPSITLAYDIDQEDKVMECAALFFCGKWDAHTEIRWRAVLADDEKRRKT